MRCRLPMRFSSFCRHRLSVFRNQNSYQYIYIYICEYTSSVSTRIPKPSHDSPFSSVQKFHTPTYLYMNTRRSQWPTIFPLVNSFLQQIHDDVPLSFLYFSKKSTSINNMKVNKFGFKMCTKHNINP